VSSSSEFLGLPFPGVQLQASYLLAGHWVWHVGSLLPIREWLLVRNFYSKFAKLTDLRFNSHKIYLRLKFFAKFPANSNSIENFFKCIDSITLVDSIWQNYWRGPTN
jgi:hypothetical protein